MKAFPSPVRVAPDASCILEALPQAVYWKGLDGTYLGCNTAFAALSGSPAADAIIGRRDDEIGWDLPQSDYYREVERQLIDSEGGELRTVEPFRSRDGACCWIRARRQLLRDADGRVVGLLGSFEDITRRVEEQRQIEEERDGLRRVLEAVADGVITTDGEGRVRWMNAAAERLIGVSADAARGAPLERLYSTVDPAVPDASRDPFGRARESGRPHSAADLRMKVQYLCNDGHGLVPRAVSETVAPLYDSDGGFDGVVVVFRDVSLEQSEAEKRRHASRMEGLGQLAGGIAHDFNNMLGGIMAATDLLRERMGAADPGSELVSVISNTSNRARDLVAKLLSFSRRGRKRSESIVVEDLVGNVLTLVAGGIDKRIRIVSELDVADARVRGDPAELESALLNICLNARDAMPEGGTLTLRGGLVTVGEGARDAELVSLRPGRYIRIEIEDTGCGIEPELQQRIFDPFFTTKPHGVGTGLGLAAAYGAVKEHEGAISIESEPGTGSVFEILLPAAGREPEPAGPPAGEGVAHEGHGTLLVADDEPALRMTTRLMLEQMGYEVILTSNGQECIDAFHRHRDRIRGVVLDYSMPVKNGQECLAELLEAEPGLRVLLTSGYAPDSRIGEMKRDGLCSFLGKPYRYHELAAALDRMLATAEGEG